MPAPIVDIAIESGDWPPEPELRHLADAAMEAAAAALNTGSPVRRDSFDGTPSATETDAPLATATEVSILFTDDAAIRALNARFRGKDKPTNVLSFPQASGPLLGDIVLAAETVQNEAALAGKPLEAHMAHLIIHGFLHLLGYDHETDAEAEAMERVERSALGMLGFADPAGGRSG